MRKLKDKTLLETGRQLSKEEAATAWKSLQQEMLQRMEAEKQAELKQIKTNFFKGQAAPAPAPEPDHKHEQNMRKQREENNTQHNTTQHNRTQHVIT